MTDDQTLALIGLVYLIVLFWCPFKDKKGDDNGRR